MGEEISEPKKWKQLNELVQSRSKNLSATNTLSSLSRPLLVLQQAEHESFEEIEHLDEPIEDKKKSLQIEKDEFRFQLWCPYCNADLGKRNSLLNNETSNESFSSTNQYVTARSRSSSTSTYVDLTSLSSENTPERTIRRYSAQSSNQSQALVISPRFSSTKRKSIRDKQVTDNGRKAVSSSNLTNESDGKSQRQKSSSPSIGSRSKTTTSNSTSNSISKSTMSNFEQYIVETFLNKNKETGSIKQLTVIRYNCSISDSSGDN